MPKAHILLVEGKRIHSFSVLEALEAMPWEMTWAQTGQQALALSKKHAFHLIIYNASTMRSSGSRSCRQLKQTLATTPLIHIRPDGQPVDETIEADVFLEQPFTPRKLKNRIKSLLPVEPDKEEIIRCGAIVYFKNKRSVEVIGKGENRLTPKLAALLEEFLLHFNQVVSRKQLMQNVWQTDYVGDTRTLDVHIRWVRELIEPDPAAPLFLLTVRGEGYRLTMPAPHLLHKTAK